MEKELKIKCKLLTDHSNKAKIIDIAKVWCVYLVIVGLTRIPAVQNFILENLKNQASFIIDGIPYIAIPMVGFSIYEYLKKHTYNELYIYNTGVSFVDSKTNTETYAPYEDIELSYGKLRESFHIACKNVNIANREYGWGEFENKESLRNELQKYGKWT